MPELRVDPLTGLRSLIAEGRAERPGGGSAVDPAPPLDPSEDPFLEGHEDRTPPEVAVFGAAPGRAPNSPGWAVRAFPNRFPALDPDAAAGEPSAVPDLFASRPARGAHEVVVNAPHAATSLAELEPAQLTLALEAWRARMRAHAGAACVHLLVNEGRDAGASLPHTHAQLYALDFVPAAIARERERARAYATQTMGGTLLADLLQEEVRRRERIVAIDDEAVLLAPFASRVPFQLMLVPRTARQRFEDDGPTGAGLLHEGLARLTAHLGATPPLNLWVRTAPSGSDHFCWRIDVLPRLTQFAGLELGTGVDLNELPPEHAAAALRAG